MEAAVVRRRNPVESPDDLQRFVTAQDGGGTYALALAELRQQAQPLDVVHLPAAGGAGVERTSQVRPSRPLRAGRGARLPAHPVLGGRLLECTGRWRARGRASRTSSAIDDLKFRSCMTLFLPGGSGEPLFQRVLDHYFGGLPDAATDQLLAGNTG